MFSAGILDAPSRYNWQTDPSTIDRSLVLELVKLYFQQVNDTIMGIFTEDFFLDWAGSDEYKSEDDLMLLYTMLTLATNFSTRPDRRSLSNAFGRIARYAMEARSGHYTIQLAQSRLLLSLHYFSLNQTVEACEMSALAARTANGMRLNVEETEETSYDEKMDNVRRRRTFWAIYLLDVSNLPSTLTINEQTLTIFPAAIQRLLLHSSLCSRRSGHLPALTRDAA